jgi:RNA polymerase sigma-70 factor (ECF subfamily)
MLMLITKSRKTELHEENVCDRFSTLTDDELAERAKSDESALAALYRRHVQRIARYISRRIRQQQEAEDVTSQVFMSMVRGLPKWQSGNAPFLAWLFRLATNAIISWSRRQKIRRWIGLSSEPTSNPVLPMDDVEELNLAMQQLREPYLSTIVLHYIEQLPVTMVAKVMGVSEGTVKSRLARGRTILKHIIESKQK